jgi:hypothetical protein
MPVNKLSFNISARCCNFDVVWKGRPTFHYLCYQLANNFLHPQAYTHVHQKTARFCFYTWSTMSSLPARSVCR